METTLSGTIFDVVSGRVFRGIVEIANGIIANVTENANSPETPIIMPGLVDAHVHIESSMLPPSEFARLATPHGTVATVSDPHEIANVLGAGGIRYMIDNGRETPFKFYFGAPSCVPATIYETAGAEISANDIRELFASEKAFYLSEMMNFPGVLSGDPIVMKKIETANEFGLPIDGHAPGLRGKQVELYASTGVSTDHECFTLDEALDKIKCGMKILIREGSAAKNFEALHPLISLHPDYCMFCSDDKHPDSLVEGHINELMRRAIALGCDKMNTARIATLNPVRHYGLRVGLMQKGDPADCIAVESLETMQVLQTYIDGQLVAERGKTKIPAVRAQAVNNFMSREIATEQIAIPAKGKMIRVIEARDGQLMTGQILLPARIEDGFAVSDADNDILKIVVINRYESSSPAIGFIRNFGLLSGAISSSVAHDSHNIIAVGVADADICRAINAIMREKGGIAVVGFGSEDILPLPIAGLMSDADGYATAQQYARLDALAKKLGSKLDAPFMTLSFMSLLVIPSLKLSDRGLFDGSQFCFTSVFADSL